MLFIQNTEEHAPPARAAPPAGATAYRRSRLATFIPATGNHHLVYARTHFIFVRPTSIRTPAALEFGFLRKSNVLYRVRRRGVLRNCLRWRPYRVKCTGSLLTSEVKRRRARLVLGWGTAWEDLRVLSAFLPRTIWNCGATQPNCLRHPRLGAWHEMIGGAGRRVVGHGWRVGGGGSPRENPILKRPAANNQDSKCRTLHDQLQTSATRNAGN